MCGEVRGCCPIFLLPDEAEDPQNGVTSVVEGIVDHAIDVMWFRAGSADTELECSLEGSSTWKQRSNWTEPSHLSSGIGDHYSFCRWLLLPFLVVRTLEQHHVMPCDIKHVLYDVVNVPRMKGNMIDRLLRPSDYYSTRFSIIRLAGMALLAWQKVIPSDVQIRDSRRKAAP